MSKHTPNYQKSKNLMMSSIMPISVRKEIVRKLNITHTINAQSTIVKRSLNGIFKVKIEVLAWSCNHTLGIFNAITDTYTMHV